MTEYEIADLAFSRQMEIQGLGHSLMAMLGLISESVTIYMSVLFGYIAAAYFVGGELKRVQLWLFTALYIFWQLLTVSTIAFRSQAGALMNGRIQTLIKGDPAETQIAANAGLWIGNSVVTMLIMALLASLYFMWSVRHSKTE